MMVKNRPMISVITTVRNEARNIAHLLDSLVGQAGPREIIVVDANSEDGTQDVVRGYAERYDEVRLMVRGGKRGFCRNLGVEEANGDVVAFIDGDCIANPFWLREIWAGLESGADMVAGKTINIGYRPFADLGRVELYYKGFDVTYPSCNLAYTKESFLKAGGFDDDFVTAEDIDLNYRAINAGCQIRYNPRMVVYAKARDTFVGFFKQAFWNGYGRKQLTLKHGRLWGNYSYSEMFKRKMSFWYFARMATAMAGYLTCKFLRGLENEGG